MLIDEIKIVIKKWLKSPQDDYLEQFYLLIKRMIKAIVFKNYLNKFESDDNVEMFAHDCATNLTLNLKEGKIKRLNSRYLNLYVLGFIKLYETGCKNTPEEFTDTFVIRNDEFKESSCDDKVFYNEMFEYVVSDIKRIARLIGFNNDDVFCSYILLSKILRVNFKRNKKIKHDGFWFLFNVCDILIDFIGYDEKIWYKDVLKYSLLKRNNKLLKIVLYGIKNKSGIEFFLNDFCKKDILKYKNVLIQNKIFDKIKLL